MTIGIDARMLGIRHGGIGRYVLELIKNLLKIDGNNRYVIFYNSKNCDQKDIDDIKLFSNARLVAADFRHYSLGEQLGFYRLLKSQNLDLVHFPNFNVPLLYDRPFVVTIHDLVHHKIGGAKKSHLLHFLAYKKVISSAARRARKIITVSQSSAGDIKSILGAAENKIAVIYEAPSLSGQAAADEVKEVLARYFLSRPYFLFVGVLERKKNLVNLTRGFDYFLQKYKVDMDLVVVGKIDHHYPEIKHKAMDIKNS